MKGLLLKDLYTLKGFAKQYGLICGIMLVWSIGMKNLSFFMMYVLVLGSLLVLTTMGTDEAVSFNRFALTMPVSINQVVKTKYVLLMITAGIGLTASLLLNVISVFIWKENDILLDFIGIIGCMFVFAMANAIALPVIFKYSVETARYIYIAVMLVLTFTIAGGIKVLEFLGISLDVFNKVSPVFVITILFAFMIAGIILSYKVAVAFAKKREW